MFTWVASFFAGPDFAGMAMAVSTYGYHHTSFAADFPFTDLPVYNSLFFLTGTIILC